MTGNSRMRLSLGSFRIVGHPEAIHLSVPRTRRHLPRLPGVRVHTTTRPFQPDDRFCNLHGELSTRAGATR